MVHYSGAFGVAEGVFGAARASQTSRRNDVALRGSAAVPALHSCIAPVPVHAAKIFLERIPTLDGCGIPFHTSLDSLELPYRNDLFEKKLFRRAAKVLRGLLSSVDWKMRTEKLR